MRYARLLCLMLMVPGAAFASDDADDWKLIGGALSLVQQIVSLAAHSSDPAAAQRGVDAMLSGQSPEANRLASGILSEILMDVPAEHRDTFVGIGRDLVTLARREQARTAVQTAQQADAAAGQRAREEAVRARQELNAMGLRYWDEQQFREAVKRGDRIAVDLFIAGQGLAAAELPRNPPAAR